MIGLGAVTLTQHPRTFVDRVLTMMEATQMLPRILREVLTRNLIRHTVHRERILLQATISPGSRLPTVIPLGPIDSVSLFPASARQSNFC